MRWWTWRPLRQSGAPRDTARPGRPRHRSGSCPGSCPATRHCRCCTGGEQPEHPSTEPDDLPAAARRGASADEAGGRVDFSQGLAAAADDEHGLAATVLTRSMEHAQRAWRELPVGTVKINAVFGGAPGGAAQPRAASGSGFGFGPELLGEMTVTKVVHLGLASGNAR